MIPAAGQTKLEPDAQGCADSAILPKLPNCRIDNCEKKASDHRDIPIQEDANGQTVTAAIDGESRSVMYECSENTTSAAIAQQAAAALRAAHFHLLYQFIEREATISATRADQWVMVDAASRYYTVLEMKAAAPDLEPVTETSGMTGTSERNGRIPVYGIRFLPGRTEMTPESDAALVEVATILEEHPEWLVRIESHTDNTGSKAGNLTLSSRRASVVVNWLAAHGIKRARLEAQGMGDSQPVADNDTEAGRAKNERIEVVKLAGQ